MKVLVLVCLALIGYSNGYQLCKTPADVVLVVEDSSFMDAADVGKLQTFLADIVNYYTLGKVSVAPEVDQVAYMQYSTGNKNIFHLNDYTETNDAKSAVLRAGFTLSPFTKSGPLIAPALTYTWTDELTVGNGERSCNPTIVILVSYSSYGDVNNANAVDPAKAKQEAEDISAAAVLKDSDALVITVGIGKHRNPKLLIKLASDPKYYHDYTDWDALNEDEADIIAKQACDYTVDGIFYPCEMPRVAADVIFVVDKSNGFSADPTFATDIQNFIKNFLAPYKWNSDVSDDGVQIGVQAALVTYSKDADVAIQLGDAKTLDEFNDRVQKALISTCPGNCPDTCIHSALDQINNHIFVGGTKYRDCDALHYIYVFTASCFRCSDADSEPVLIANSLRTAKNTEIFVVPLQKNPSFNFWKEPLEIADDASHLFEAQNDPASILLNYLHKQAWRTVCVSPKFACATTTSTSGPTTSAATAASTGSEPTPGPGPKHPKALKPQI